jgi:hypothetical protein
VLTGPFSPLFGPFFRAKRAGPARFGPLRAELGQKLKPAGSAGPARFWPGFTGPGPGRAGPARLAIYSPTPTVRRLSHIKSSHPSLGCGLVAQELIERLAEPIFERLVAGCGP